MAEEITLKLTVDSVNGAKSVKEIKDLIRDATNEALKFEQGSKEFAKFANIAAQAKDKLGDVRAQMAALNPDAKAQAFTKLGGAIVGGFTAAQGAMALFGASTEDVQKALLKVQSAMALLAGFQAVQDGIAAFTALRGAIMITIASMNAMKIALISTGIGAFVVLVGILVSQFASLNETVEEVDKTLQDSQAELQNLQLEWQKLTGAISEVEFAITNAELIYKKKLQEINDNTEKELKKTVGFWNQAWNFISTGGNAAAAAQKTFDQVTEIGEKGAKQTEALEATHQQELANIKEKARQDDAKKAQKAFEDRKAKDIGDTNYIKEQTEIGLLEISKIEQKALDRDNAAVKKSFAERSRIIRESTSEQLKFMLNDANTRIQIEQQVFSAIFSVASSTIKNQEKLANFQKKLAAVNIIVSQAEALAKAVAGAQSVPFPGNLVAIATVVSSIAGIFAGIKALFSKAGDVGGAPSLDTGTGFSGASSAASSNVPSGVSFLEQPSTNLGTGGNTPPPPIPPIIIENHISESEITKVQNSVNSIQTQATIG